MASLFREEDLFMFTIRVFLFILYLDGWIERVISMIQISISELKTNTGKYVALAGEHDIFITKNGKRIAKITSAKPDKVAAAKELFGILPVDTNLDEAREERLKWERY